MIEQDIPDVKHDFTVSPTVSNWPFKSFQKFKQFAASEAGDSYWVAIDKLLNQKERITLLEKQLKLYEEIYGMGFDETEEEIEEEQEERPVTLGE